MTEDNIQDEQALLFMEAWGDGSALAQTPFHGFGYTIKGYYPEHASERIHNYFKANDDLVMTVLANNLASKTPADIEGYREVFRYPAGEVECPGTQFDEHGDDCPICQGDKFVYWGEEWHVHVLVPILVPERRVLSSGTVLYTIDDGEVFHREGGPAVMDSTQQWYVLGSRHRENGPAYTEAGFESYYIDDYSLTPSDYFYWLMDQVPTTIPTWDEAEKIIEEKAMEGNLKEHFEAAVRGRVTAQRLSLWQHLGLTEV